MTQGQKIKALQELCADIIAAHKKERRSAPPGYDIMACVRDENFDKLTERAHDLGVKYS